MSALDGLTLFEQIRADPLTCTIPVIFFTATETRITHRLPHYRQMNAYFIEKTSLRELVTQIEVVLGLTEVHGLATGTL